MSRAQPPVDLAPDFWLLKLLLPGAADSSYDTKDETSGRTGEGAPSGQQQYGGAPQCAPSSQQSYYGRPAQGQYGVLRSSFAIQHLLAAWLGSAVW